MSLTQEQENFVKLSRLILDVVPTYLRQYFEQKWNAKYPQNKWDGTCQSGQFLLNQIPPQVRNNSRNRQYLINLGNGDASDWDPTTLFFVLLFSDLQLITPCRVKAKRISPLLDSEYVDHLREIRNEFFAHPKNASVSSVDFQTVIAKLKNVCTLFGSNYTQEVEKIEQSTVQNELSQRLKEVLKTQKTFNVEFNEWLQEAKEELTDIKVTVKETNSDVKEIKTAVQDTQEGFKEVKTAVKDTISEFKTAVKNLQQKRENMYEITEDAIKEKYKKDCKKHDINIVDYRGSIKTDCVPIEKFAVNVKIIHQPDSEESFHNEKARFFQRLEQSGNNIDISNIFCGDRRIVFIRGIAGIGKSVLAKQIAFQWANGPLFAQFHHLFYFECREFNDYVQQKKINDKLIKDFLDEEKMFNDGTSKNDGNVLFLIDGLDELNNSRSFVEKFTSLYDQSKFIFLGRPHTQAIFDNSRGKIECPEMLELLGLQDDEIKSYVSMFLELSNRETNDNIKMLSNFKERMENREVLCRNDEDIYKYNAMFSKLEFQIKDSKMVSELRSRIQNPESAHGNDEESRYVEQILSKLKTKIENRKKNLKKTIETSDNVSGISTIPQFLNTLCCVAIMTNGCSVSSTTDLYAWVLYLLFIQHLHLKDPKELNREPGEEEDDVGDVFTKYFEVLKSITPIVYEMYVNNQIVFEEKTIMEEIKRLDALQIDLQKDFFKSLFCSATGAKKRQFKHLTIMEFIASLYFYFAEDRYKVIEQFLEKKSYECISFICSFEGRKLVENGLEHDNLRDVVKVLDNKDGDSLGDADSPIVIRILDKLKNNPDGLNFEMQLMMIRFIHDSIKPSDMVKEKDLLRKILGKMTPCLETRMFLNTFNQSNWYNVLRMAMENGISNKELREFVKGFTVVIYTDKFTKLIEHAGLFHKMELYLRKMKISEKDARLLAKHAIYCQIVSLRECEFMDEGVIWKEMLTNLNEKQSYCLRVLEIHDMDIAGDSIDEFAQILIMVKDVLLDRLRIDQIFWSRLLQLITIAEKKQKLELMEIICFSCPSFHDDIRRKIWEAGVEVTENSFLVFTPQEQKEWIRRLPLNEREAWFPEQEAWIRGLTPEEREAWFREQFRQIEGDIRRRVEEERRRQRRQELEEERRQAEEDSNLSGSDEGDIIDINLPFL